MEATTPPAVWSPAVNLPHAPAWDTDLPPAPSSSLATWERWDRNACRQLNGWGRRPWLRDVFAMVSRLGDGLLWYLLMGVLPLVRPHDGWRVAATMLLAGALCLVLYKSLKHLFRRERPHVLDGAIVLRARQLDRYSFPSGHTLHAVGFTVVVVVLLPALAPLVVPFALLVALSRPILGLHYPSDVLAGGLIGGVVGFLALQLSFLLFT